MDKQYITIPTKYARFLGESFNLESGRTITIGKTHKVTTEEYEEITNKIKSIGGILNG